MKSLSGKFAMMRFVSFFMVSCAMCAGVAHASNISVQVVDQAGAPVQDAIVYAVPVSGRLPATRPAPAAIDQVKRRFVPMVSVVQTGASVTFPNKDNIEHDVYSFSPAKRFELNLYHGIPAKPVVFDKPGLVVMGCNIHDTMVAYLLIVDTPYFAKTDANGAATLASLPPDSYRLVAWHFRLTDANAQPAQQIAANGDASAKFVLQLKKAE
jgi:plastocyanin